ncbi:MAG: SDR family oxidoreductase [Coriobacteriia bacterium]|nr:SDR family oxidoreductase [Coriobacteriia bacterium]
MNGTILVTGATGNVGAEVIRGLLERGAKVRGATLAGDTRLPAGAESVLFDFEDPATFAAALEGVDRVFLMRPPHMGDARAFEPFLAAMRERGVRQVVFLSLLGVERNPVVPHHAIEKRLKASGLGWTMLRPSFFMQNLSTTHLADIRERGEIVVPAGGGRTSFIDVRDIAAAAVVALTDDGHLGRAYALTGSEALTYDECAAILTEVCDRPVRYTRVSSRAFARHMAALGHPGAFITVMRGIYLVARLRMAATITDELQVLIGREPTTFRQFAADNAVLLRG